MDLHGTDDWLFEELENDENCGNIKNVGELKKLKEGKKDDIKSSTDLSALKQTLHQYEIKQKANETEKQVFLENFYQLLVTARSQIRESEKKILDLSERLNSYMSVKCPECNNCFKCGDSRLLPKYIRYVKACNRLELDFSTEEELKRWLLVSNLDTDSNGLPIISEEKKETKTLKGLGSLIVEGNKPTTLNRNKSGGERIKYRLDVENLSSRFSLKELKELFSKVSEVVDGHLHEKERNKAAVYFHYHNHLRRVIDKYQGKKINDRRIKLIDRTDRK